MKRNLLFRILVCEYIPCIFSAIVSVSDCIIFILQINIKKHTTTIFNSDDSTSNIEICATIEIYQGHLINAIAIDFISSTNISLEQKPELRLCYDTHLVCYHSYGFAFSSLTTCKIIEMTIAYFIVHFFPFLKFYRVNSMASTIMEKKSVD